RVRLANSLPNRAKEQPRPYRDRPWSTEIPTATGSGSHPRSGAVAALSTPGRRNGLHTSAAGTRRESRGTGQEPGGAGRVRRQPAPGRGGSQRAELRTVLDEEAPGPGRAEADPIVRELPRRACHPDRKGWSASTARRL